MEPAKTNVQLLRLTGSGATAGIDRRRKSRLVLKGDIGSCFDDSMRTKRRSEQVVVTKETTSGFVNILNAVANVAGSTVNAIDDVVSGVAGLVTDGIVGTGLGVKKLIETKLLRKFLPAEYADEMNLLDTGISRFTIANPTKKDIIRVGDIVFFSSAQHEYSRVTSVDGGIDSAVKNENRLLFGDGHHDMRCGVFQVDNPMMTECLDDSFFRILVQESKSKSKDDGEGDDDVDDNIDDDELENAEIEDKTIGNSNDLLKFGQEFYLMHVSSGKYLKSFPRVAAIVERECTRLGLTHGRKSADCLFRFQPGFKGKDYGYVFANDMVSIVNDKTELLLHVGSEQSVYYPSDESVKEIEANLSSVSTEGKGPFSWRVGRYACNEELDGKALLVGEAIRLCHSQLGSFLSCSSRNGELEIEKRSSSYRTILKAPKWKHRHDPASSVKDIFIIERPSRFQGGAVQWKKPYRLRHLISGCYLSVCPSTAQEAYGDQSLENQRCSFMLRPRLANDSSYVERLDLMLATLFLITPSSAVDADAYVDMSETSVRIQHSVPLFRLRRNSILGGHEESDANGDKGGMKENTDYGDDEHESSSVNCFLSVGPVAARSERPCLDLMDGTARAAAHTYGPVTVVAGSRAVAFKNIPSEGDVIKLWRVSEDELVTLKFLMKCVSIMTYYERILTKLFKPGDTGELVIIPEEASLRLQRMIEDINNLLCCSRSFTDRGFRSFLPKSATDFEKQKCIRHIQLMIKDSRVLDYFFYLLRLPSYVGIHWDYVRTNKDLSLAQTLVSSMISRIGADNSRIQVYAAQQKYCGFRNHTFDHEWEGSRTVVAKKTKKREEPSISFLGEPLQQLQVGLGASGVVEEYVTNNLWLLETLLDNKVLLYIVDLLKDRGPVKTLIDLLVSTCSCYGISILGNQERLMAVIYSSCGGREFMKNRYNLLVETALWDKQRLAASSLVGKAFQRVDSGGEGNGKDVVVSWVGSEHFHPGKAGIGALYFDFATIGLSSIDLPDDCFPDLDGYLRRSEMKPYDVRHWVCLREIAWSVNSTYTPRTEEYAGVDEKLARRVASYYLSILRMFSELCKSRSKKCVDMIKKQFTFDLLLVGAKDKRLPASFRAAFVSILHSAYVDSHPHEPLLIPALVKIVGMCQTQRTEDAMLPRFVHPDFLSDYVSSIYESSALPEAKAVDRYGRNLPIAVVESKNESPDISDSNDIDKFNSLMELVFDEFRDDLRPFNKKGGSPLDNYRFCLVLLELSDFLLRSGFIFSMDKLVGYSRLLIRFVSSHATMISRPTRERKQLVEIRKSLDMSRSAANLKRPDQLNPDSASAEKVSQKEKDVKFGRGRVLAKIRSRLKSTDGKSPGVISMIRSGAKNAGVRVVAEAKSLIHDHESDDEEEEGNEVQIQAHSDADDLTSDLLSKAVGDKAAPDLGMSYGGAVSMAKKFDLGTELSNLCEAYDRRVIPEVVTDVLVENQRYLVSWVPQPSIAARGPYSYPKSNPSLENLYGAFRTVSDNRFTGDGVPDRNWKWTTVWETKPECKGIRSEDAECWIYAFDWRSDFMPKCDVTKFVRRRSWIRSRSLKTAKQIAEELIGESTSPADLLMAFRSAIETNDVTIDTVLSCLAREMSQAKPLRRILTRQPALEDTDQQKPGAYVAFLNRCCCVTLASLSSVADVSIDVRLTQFSNNFKDHFDKNTALVDMSSGSQSLTKVGEELINSMFTDVCAQLDFKKLESGKLIPSLIQVIMSEDSNICNYGLQTMTRLFCGFSRTCKKFDDLQMLINKPAVNGFAITKSCIGRLRNTTFSFVRSNFSSSDSVETRNMCVDLDGCFRLLGDRIYPSCKINFRYSFDVQNSLRKQGAHIFALAVLQHSLQSDDAVAGAANELTSMRRSAALFLAKFVKNNAQNQQLSSSYLPLLLATLDRRFGTANILFEMHKDNFFLSQIVPEELIVKYFDIIDESSVELEYLWPMLDLLKNCVFVNGCPIKQNQALVLRHLLNPKYKRVCVTFTEGVISEDKDETMTVGYQKRLGLLQEYDINTEDRNGRLLMYHSRIVELLALCCAGKNAACEIKCQQRLPLSVVLAVLSDPLTYNCQSVVNGFAKYFFHVFLDVSEFKKVVCNKIDSIDIESNPMLWIVLDKYASVINQFSSQPTNEALAEIVFDAVLPTFRAYFSRVIRFTGDAVSDPSHSKVEELVMGNIQGVMQSLVENSAGYTGRRRVILNECAKILGITSRPNQNASRQGEIKVDCDDEAIVAALKEFDRFKECFEVYSTTLKKSTFLKTKENEEFSTLLGVLINCDYILASKDGFNLSEVLRSSSNCKYLEPIRKIVLNDGGVMDVADTDQAGPSKKVQQIKFSTMVGRIIKHIREMILSGNEKEKKGYVSFGKLKDLSSTLQDEVQSTYHLIHSLRLFTSILSRVNVEESEEVEQQKQLLLGPDQNNNNPQTDDSSFGLLTLAALQNLFVENNAAELVVDIISSTADPEMVDEALLFGNCLLEGGNGLAQDRIYDYLTANRNVNFFRNMFDRIATAGKAARSWYRWKEFQVRKFKKLLDDKKVSGWEEWKTVANSDLEGFEEEEDTISRQESLRDLQIFGAARPELVFRILQLFCEGHNSKMQNLLRLQSGFSLNYDIVEAGSNLLCDCAPSVLALSMIEEPEAGPLLQILDFLVEAVQGPCASNQESLADGTLIQTCCRLLEFELTPANGLVPFSTVADLRVGALKFLISLVEGRSDPQTDTVYSVIVEKLPPSLLRMRLERLCEASRERAGPPILSRSMEEQGFLVLSLAKQLSLCDVTVMQSIEPRQKALQFPEMQEIGQGDEISAKDRSSSFQPDIKVVELAALPDPALIASTCNDFKNDIIRHVMYRELYLNLSNKVRSVEVAWEGRGLVQTFFPLPAEFAYISEDLKTEVKSRLDFSDDDRVKDLLQMKDEFYDDISYKQSLSKSWIAGLALFFLDEIDYATLFLCIVINFLLIVSLRRPGQDSSDSSFHYKPDSMGYVVNTLGVLFLLLTAFKLSQSLLLSAPLVVKRVWREQQALVSFNNSSPELSPSQIIADSLNCFSTAILCVVLQIVGSVILYGRFGNVAVGFWAVLLVMTFLSIFSGLRDLFRRPFASGSKFAVGYASLYDIIMHSKTRFRIVFFVCAILAIGNQPYFYGVQLLAIIQMSPILQNVVKAVTIPWKSLILAALLGVVAVYIFALLGFSFLSSDFENADTGENECQTLILCFASFLHNGLSGGIGDYINGLGNAPNILNTKDFSQRLLYDISYFIIVIVLMLNIIFGIIIDTFSALREEAAERDRVMSSYCFVCGLSKDLFDEKQRKSGSLGKKVDTNTSMYLGYQYHIRHEHNMWDYVAFAIHLKLKDSTEYTGVESYVAEKIRIDDLSWVPKNACGALKLDNDDDDGDGDSLSNESLLASMKSNQDALIQNVQALLSKVNEDRDNIRDMLRKIKSDVAELQEGQKSPRKMS